MNEYETAEDTGYLSEGRIGSPFPEDRTPTGLDQVLDKEPIFALESDPHARSEQSA